MKKRIIEKKQAEMKYQTSTCEQLYQEKAQNQGKPKSAEEQRAIEILRSDPKMQAAFFGKISTPVVSKMSSAE